MTLSHIPTVARGLTERIHESMKDEAVQKGSTFWARPLKTLADVEELAFDWVDWYSNERLHSTLGNIPPEELEAAYYDEINDPSTGGAANKTEA